MSIDWHVLAGCDGKVAHPTAGGAHKALRIVLRRNRHVNERGTELAVYRCRFCTQWHIGNQGRR